MDDSSVAADPDYEAIVIGAGVCGIYQLYRLRRARRERHRARGRRRPRRHVVLEPLPGRPLRLREHHLRLLVLRGAAAGVGLEGALLRASPRTSATSTTSPTSSTCARTCSSAAPSSRAVFDDDATLWRLHLDDGRELTCRFLIPAIGLLSAPTLPRYEGIDDFQGQSFHTYNWPEEPVEHGRQARRRHRHRRHRRAGDRRDRRQGRRADRLPAPARTGAPRCTTPRSPPRRWPTSRPATTRSSPSAPARPGGFIHEPDRRPFFEVPREERLAKWEQLYGEPGFGIWLANFRDTFMDEEANAELSEFIADKIRSRVHDPVARREADPQGPRLRRPAGADGDPLLRGLQPRQRAPRRPPGDADRAHHADTASARPSASIELDIIVYATGFDAVTGAYDRIDIRGVGGQSLREKWADGPVTYFGHAGRRVPEHVHADRPAERLGVDELPARHRARRRLVHRPDAATCGSTATPARRRRRRPRRSGAPTSRELYGMMLMRKAQGWFTGYNSNVEGHEKGTIRYLVYNGGTPKFRREDHRGGRRRATPASSSADGGHCLEPADHAIGADRESVTAATSGGADVSGRSPSGGRDGDVVDGEAHGR